MSLISDSRRRGIVGGSDIGLHLVSKHYPPSPFAVDSVKPSGVISKNDNLEKITELSDIAELYFDQGKLSEAISALDQAIEIDPNQPVLQFNRAGVNLFAGKLEQALLDVNRAIELGLRIWDAYYILGDIHMSMENYGQSFSAFQRACELEPPDLLPLVGLGASLSCLGRHNEALEVLTDIIAKKPDNFVLGRTHYWMGVSYLETVRFEDGDKHLSEAIKLLQHDSIPHNELGYLLVEKGEYERAISILKMSLELKQSVETYCNISRAHMRLSQYKKAQKNIIKSMDLDQKNPIVYSVYGDLFRLNNKMQEAEQIYRRAIELVQHKPMNQRNRNDYRAVIRALNGLSKLDIEVNTGLMEEAITRSKLTQEMVNHIMHSS